MPVRTDDCTDRPGTESQTARRVGVLFGIAKLLRSARDFAREEWPPSGAVRLMS
jgi:hypothetical protein